jgi:DHA1 family tetracycline resistance protein-like MFS transporter
MQPQPAPASIPRNALIFILITAFLNLAGIGLIGPVSAFLVERYLTTPEEVAVASGLLFTSYSFFQFLAVPALGVLSDRFGRRPVLLLCLLGSALGYLLFGIGGALWVLFVGRIIDGITGGNLAAIFAYIADLTQPQERTRYYGLVGAVSGLGFVIGPAVGGALSQLGGTTAPVYFAAFITLLNMIWGYFAMPESLAPEKRITQINVTRLNPLSQLIDVFRLPQLRWLLLASFIFTLPFALLSANLTVLGKDYLGAQPADIAVVFTVFGLVGIIVQGGLIRPLIARFGEFNLAVAGAVISAVGLFILSTIPTVRETWDILLGAAVFALGNGLLTPTLTGLISQAVGARDQGRAQGGSQAVQALARVLGPIGGSAAYVQISAGSPYWIGALLGILVVVCLYLALPALKAAMALRAAPAHEG